MHFTKGQSRVWWSMVPPLSGTEGERRWCSMQAEERGCLPGLLTVPASQLMDQRNVFWSRATPHPSPSLTHSLRILSTRKRRWVLFWSDDRYQQEGTKDVSLDTSDESWHQEWDARLTCQLVHICMCTQSHMCMHTHTQPDTSLYSVF